MMRHRAARLWGIALCLAFADSALAQPKLQIANDRYRVVVETPAAGTPVVTVTRLDQSGVVRALRPRLLVLFSETDPGYGRTRLKEEVTLTAGWRRAGARDAESDFFKANPGTVHEATGAARAADRALVFQFSPGRGYELGLRVSLPPGHEPPIIEPTLTAGTDGYYAVGFAGIEPRDPASLDFLFQPLVWSWKRFPERAYLTPEAFATTAAVFTTAREVTEGLAVDPAEIPYRFATFENSRFGLLLRDTDGRARPMVMAPVFGGDGSRCRRGESLAFKSRYVLTGGGWYAAVAHILGDIAGYRAERQNATASLNETLENMIAFGMDDHYSGWVPELKGFDYRFDVPGTVKVVSALHALEVALVTGDAEIYRRRALPLIEYVMSREKYLYSTDEAITTQNPSHFLRGPCVELGELAGLFEMTGGKSVAFRREAERLFGRRRRLNLLTDTGGGTWQDELAMYRVTQNPARLSRAKAGADAHLRTELEQFPTDFATNPALVDKQAAFYTDYGPRWFDLTELFEATGERRYLDAAVTGARAMLLMLRSNPMAPPTQIVVNRGGKVPGIFKGRRVTGEKWEEHDTTSYVAEQRVPAWRTSLTGLPPEQGYTYGNGPIMLTHHAAWMLRLAHYAHDPLLREAAINAVVGRYANFPGYYFTSLATTLYQRPDYPLHPYSDIKYNAIFYNHVWPHIALLVDYLVSDAFARSNGQIDFPSAFAPGYAYLTSKVYGHRLGRIYGDEGVALWLPRRAATFSTPAVNHLFGVGQSDLYLVLMNTAAEERDVLVRLNPDVIPWNAGQSYEVTWLGTATGRGRMDGGELRVPVPPDGLIVAKIHGLTVDTSFQRRVAAPLSHASADRGYARIESGSTAVGTLTAMLISVVREFADAYVYLDATEKTTREVEFRYRLGQSDWTTVRDTVYPFELSVHMADANKPIEITVEALDHQGQRHAGPHVTLAR